jgi:DNA-binding CsgD family transcriptional regulator
VESSSGLIRTLRASSSDTELIGRDRELGAIDAFLAAATAGRSALVILGEPGIGKTALWQRAVESASGRGWQVLRAAPAEAEAHDAFTGLTDLLGAIFDQVEPSLPAPLSASLAAVLLRARDQPDQARAIGAATRAALDSIASSGSVIVAIDDAQWLDPDTARAISFAAVRTSPAVSFVVAARTDDPSILPLGLERAVDGTRCIRVRPGPLSLAGVHHVLRASLATDVPRAVLTRIAKASGGNPFVALELGRAWAELRTPTSDLVVPGSVRSLVDARLRRLAPGARDLVLHVAAAGRPTITLLEQVIGPDTPSFLEDAERAGVLIEDAGRVTASHPLLTATAYAMATQATRRRVHARLAAAVSDPEERGRHLAAAIVTPDEAAAQAIELGAMAALSRGAPSAAAELLTAAARLTPADPEAHVRLTVNEAMARLAAGEVREARALAERALAAAPTTAVRLAILSRISDIAWADGGIEREWNRIQAAVADAEDDPRLELDLRTRLVAFGVAMAPAQAKEQADAALALVEPSVDPARAGELLINREMASALGGLGIRWDQLANGIELEAYGRLTGGGMSSPPLVMYVMSDQTNEARQRFAVESNWYTEHGEEGWRAERQGQLALLELRAGNTTVASDLSAEACESLDRIGAAEGWPLVFAWRSLIDAHLGRLDRAMTTIEHTIEAQADGGQLWIAILESIHAFVAHAAGKDEASEQAVERMRAASTAVGVRDLLADRSESFLAEVRIARGDLDGARAVITALEARHATLPRSWTAIALKRSRALVLAVEGDLLGALDTLDRTDPEDLRRLPFEHGWSLLARGRILRRMREKTSAAAVLRDARDRFLRLGAQPWVEAAERELSRVGLRRRSPNELTSTELEIARLAALGLSNREMAEAAFVSPKTIEANLTRIYAKLEIRSRAELGAWMARQEGRTGAQT